MSKHLIILTTILLAPVLVAQVSEDGFVLFTPDELEWTLRENGTSLVLLEGDPQSEASTYRDSSSRRARSQRRTTTTETGTSP